MGRSKKRPLGLKSSRASASRPLSAALALGTRHAFEPFWNVGKLRSEAMNQIIYLVGLVVVVAFIASFVLGHV